MDKLEIEIDMKNCEVKKQGEIGRKICEAELSDEKIARRDRGRRLRG
jgi:hypothetical protein